MRMHACLQVLLATQLSLESGPARQLLVEWAAQPRNTIIFTERAAVGRMHAGQLHGAVQTCPALRAIRACRGPRRMRCTLGPCPIPTGLCTNAH